MGVIQGVLRCKMGLGCDSNQAEPGSSLNESLINKMVYWTGTIISGCDCKLVKPDGFGFE